MRAFAFLTLIAFASAMTGDFRPNWSKTLLDQQIQRQLFENQVRRSDFEGLERQYGKQTVAQELCDRVTQLVQNLARENASGDVLSVAQRVADGIKRLILEAKQTKITETIEKLQSQQWKGQLSGGFQGIRTAAAIRAIEHLREKLQKTEQEKQTVVTSSLENLRKTLQVVIETQLTAERCQKSLTGVTQLSNIVDRKLISGATELTPTGFLAKIQKLVIQFCIQDIQKEIAHVQQSIPQVQQQQQLVSEQRCAIQLQVVVLQQRGDIELAQRLQSTEEQLARKEEELVEQQVACSVIAENLQEAATENELQLQKETVIEQVERRALTGRSGRLY
ncbi:uncharacterized protein LOC109535208 [Dendroctonus ponderosae]|uniref:uncharacterized protein LOC109535208 n=1 Tax=Dendroctonus ponderosae TaxID=77166 RepID=UPI002034CAE2|nr:uncharacterized protein LOC109535208 [Dendroctonus ponderosae]KAH1017537.1 hypothetical protein HUJ05_008161 [Dendroctonus ponderosae]